MLVLHIKFEETITIGNEITIKVINNNQKLIFKIKGPNKTRIYYDGKEKEIRNGSEVMFLIKYNEKVYINDLIKFKIYKINNRTLYKLCIDAPKSILIFREKIIEKMKQKRICLGLSEQI